MKLLVTGGAGYIGSHTVVELINKGHSVTILDNFSNSSPLVVERINKITGGDSEVYAVDLLDSVALEAIFESNTFDAVLHFAGLKAVGESTSDPLRYYHTNVVSTLNLLDCMQRFKVHKLIFSSSATVYGNPGTTKYTEKLPAGQNISSPYGKTKYLIEEIIRDVCAANPAFQSAILRYFNPIGAHESGLIGEDPSGTPNNLFPFLTQVAIKRREKLSVFGDDYNTPDGTAIRDYIHVTDLALGHIAALEKLAQGCHIFNLGSGKGTSVVELIKTFSDSTGVDIPYEIVGRRDGDLAEYIADPTKAAEELSWKTTRDIEKMCIDSWKWQSTNPNGYEDRD